MGRSGVTGTVDHECNASIGWMGKTANNNDLDRTRKRSTQPALACTRVYHMNK